MARNHGDTTSKLHIAGKTILSLVALFTVFGGLVADFSNTHIYNPNWPPHAKFHNGQTMAMGVCLGLATLFFIWRRTMLAGTNLLAAISFASRYWVTQALASLFPGTAWTDPEFLEAGQTIDQFPTPQIILDAVLLASITIAAVLVVRGQKNTSA